MKGGEKTVPDFEAKTGNRKNQIIFEVKKCARGSVDGDATS